MDYERFPILFSATIQSLRNIDTKNSTFDVVVDVDYLWFDNRLAEIGKNIWDRGVKLGHFDPDKYSGFFCNLRHDFWPETAYKIPSLQPESFSRSEQDNHSDIIFDYTEPDAACSDGTCTPEQTVNGKLGIEYSTQFQGTVAQAFKLNDFPFDDHLLNLVFVPQLGASSSSLVVEHYNFTGVAEAVSEKSIKTIQEQNQQWKVTDYFFESVLRSVPREELHVTVPIIRFAVDRSPIYFVAKIIIPVCFILVITWSVFWIKSCDLESRLTVSIVSFLTLIAYNFVIETELPKLGYLTTMDRFILYSYIFAGIPTLETVLVKYLADNKKETLASRIDQEFRKYFLLSFAFSAIGLFNFHLF